MARILRFLDSSSRHQRGRNMSIGIRASTSNRVREFLSQTSTYPDAPVEVRSVETHISWVFLTERFAYKLKKPVKFDFVDFSTTALRRQACDNELRLNRRLAPSVYLAVLPVTEVGDGLLELDGRGRAVDWVVQMRRLPADKAMDRAMYEGRLSPDAAATVAKYLAKFYAQRPLHPVAPEDFRHAIDCRIRANESALMDKLPNERSRIRRIHSAQLRFLHVQHALFDDRVLDGRIVDGHGDLRPEHIYLEPTPVVIDCIEFSAELRQVDIADELNFVAMECQRLGHRHVGQGVLTTYERVTGDKILPGISSFYRSYRACVRAKVAALQLQQQSVEKQRSLKRLTRQYLEWADHYAAELGRPCLIVVYGLMGTGKSTLANALGECLRIQVLSTDGMRRSMFGRSESPAGYGAGIYQLGSRQLVYDALFREASGLLDKGQSTILDGAFLSQSLRKTATGLGSRHGAVVCEVVCECPRSTALRRILQRAHAGESDSEARAELYDLQAAEFEPPKSLGQLVRVNTTLDLANQVRIACALLRDVLFAENNQTRMQPICRNTR